jgi:Secretion system C-terminal sorting domain/Putative metal-binding motif
MNKLIHLLLAAFLVFFCHENIYTQCSNPEIPGNGIDEDCDGLDGIYLNLPKFIYGTEGQDLEIYFRNIILSQHPQDYTFEVNSALNGTNLGTKFKIMATDNAAGSYPITIQVKIYTGQVIAEASSVIRISPNEAPQDMTPRRLVLMGHSFFDQGYMPKYLFDMMHQSGNPPITFHGKKASWANSNARHDGYGGTNAMWFVKNGGSPIVYDNKVNMKRYFNDVICPGCTPDWLILHLDINDFCGYTGLAGNTLQEINDTITNNWNRNFNRIVDSIRVVSPNTKLGICMSPPPNARTSSFEQSYPNNPVINNKWRWQKIINCLAAKQLERYGNRESENIYLIPENVDIDDFMEYNPPDARHPDPFDNNINTHCGYNEIAKMIYSWIRWVEHNPNGTPTTPITYYRDADGDGYGQFDFTVTSITSPAGFVSVAGDCNDSNSNINPGKQESCSNNIDDNCNDFVDEDIDKPVALCKSVVNIELSNTGKATLTPAQIDNGSYDNCSIFTSTVTETNFDCTDLGLHYVLLKLIDAFGNENECQSSVNIIDAGPTALCKSSFILPLGGNGLGFIEASDVDNGSYAGCNNFNLSLNKSMFTCENIGLNQVTLKLNDVTGLEKSCQTIVNVIDTVAPIAICQASLMLNLDANGNAPIFQWQINNGSWDACGEIDYTLSQSNFNCNQMGNTFITMKVKDNSGNESNCVTQLVVSGNIAPTMQLTVDTLNLTLGQSGITSVNISTLATAMDDCSALDWQYSFNNQTFVTSSTLNFSCDQIGVNKKVWIRAHDVSGNVSQSKSINYTLIDLLSPQLICQDINITLQSGQSVLVTRDDIVITAIDNCDFIEWTPYEDLIFGCDDIGFSINVTIGAQDAHDNATTCASVITVLGASDSDNDGINDCSDACPQNALSSESLAYYPDLDNDGYGFGTAMYSCISVSGTVRNNLDCDDTNVDIYPNAIEIFNDLDDNCDGNIDEGFVGTNELSAKTTKVIAYPNPTKNEITLDWQKANDLEVVQIMLIDQMGRILKTNFQQEFSSSKTIFQVADLPSGIYFLKILFEDGNQEVKRFQKN